MTLHPKVKWPLVANTLYTVTASIGTALVSKDRGVALTAAVIGGGVTLVGLAAGYTATT